LAENINRAAGKAATPLCLSEILLLQKPGILKSRGGEKALAEGGGFEPFLPTFDQGHKVGFATL
jgi:hypothetical protein